uniref:Baseplate hub subunit tail length determinator n=1 Tax=Klebsiella phage K14-2 TaxID=3156075 RepID=A0AB39C932_9VIRU
MIMANSYFNEEQKKKFLNRNSNKQPAVTKVTASLDAESARDLKEINDNTLESAINTLDIKEGLKSFEEKFRDKFAGFKEQYEEDKKESLAEQLPDFVGPIRPISLTDDNSKTVDNTVNVNQNGQFGKLEENTESIFHAINKLVDLYENTDKHKPLPEPVEEPDPYVDTKKKRINDDDDKRSKTLDSIAKSLVSIKGFTSQILSRFIGYSLEAMAKFAKWTLLIGSLIFTFDVLRVTIRKWFEDILKEGESSKKLFGTYLGNVKAIVTKIEEGLNNFNMNNLGESLRDLFVEPMKLLGQTVQTAITEGIGRLIQSLGESTGIDSITNAGRGMQITALRDKQKFGLELTKEDILMIKKQELEDQKAALEKEDKAIAARHALTITPSQIPNGSIYKVAPTDYQERNQKTVDADKERLDNMKKATEEMQKQYDLAKSSEEEAQKLADEENKRNRARIEEAKRLEQARKEGKQPPEGEEKKGDDLLGKATNYANSENLDAADIKYINDELLDQLEKRRNEGNLDDVQKDRISDLIEQLQNKIAARTESSTPIDAQPPLAANKPDADKASNIQVNNKTVNNNVTHSVQRTEHKPLVALA